MFDAQDLSDQFLAYISGRDDFRFLQNHNMAAETWFQVELGKMLEQLRYTVTPNPNYGQTPREKADLSAELDNQSSLFELKCFVAKSDSKKKEDFPEQLEGSKLEIQKASANQGVAFLTLRGYSPEQEDRMLALWFPQEPSE